MRRIIEQTSRGALILSAMLLAGCTAVIDQSSFCPRMETPPDATLAPPPGYAATDAMLDLPGLGIVHAVRLDNPASETVIVFHGGNSNFVSAQSLRAAALAATTGADIITLRLSRARRHQWCRRPSTLRLPPARPCSPPSGNAAGSGVARSSAMACPSAAARRRRWRAGRRL